MIKKVLQLSTCLIGMLALNPVKANEDVPIKKCGTRMPLQECITFCKNQLAECTNKFTGITPAYACCNTCLSGSEKFGTTGNQRNAIDQCKGNQR